MIVAVVLLISFSVSSTSAQQMFFHLLGLRDFPDFTWTGKGSDSNWTTANNWSGNAVPGVGDTAHFIGAACTANCSPTINAAISVAGIDIQSTYSGTITQGLGFSMVVGANGWVQTAGFFVGSNAAITMNGKFTVTGGTFTSTTGILKTFSDINFDGGSFVHNSGSFVISAPSGVPAKSLNVGASELNHLKLTETTGYDGYVFNVTGTVTVNGRFDVEDMASAAPSYIIGGTFVLKGDVVSAATAQNLRLRTNMKIAGNANQSITGSSNFGLANLEIASTGGTVTFSAGFFNMGGFKYTSGTVVMPTDFVQTVEWPYTANFDAGALEFNNLEIRQSCNFDLYTLNVVGTQVVNGNLNFNYISCSSNPTINSGTFSVKGNLTSNSSYTGTLSIKVSGSGNQTISGSGSGHLSRVEIINTGGVVTISGTPHFRESFVHTSGAVTATGSTASLSGTYNTTYTLSPGAMAFDNLTFVSSFSNDGVSFDLGGATVVVNGNLVFSQPSGSTKSSVNNGLITVGKNLTASTLEYLGTARIQLVGGTASTVSVATPIPKGILKSSKNAGISASLTQALVLNGTAQDMTIDAGTFNLAGFNLTVPGVFTVGVNGKLICNGGVVTAASYVLDGQVYCPTALGIAWTGLAGDNLWTTAGNWTNNTVPGINDIALFNSACTGANCNVTVNSNISVKGVNILSTYTGNISQGAANTITIGSVGWKQVAGTFTGSSANITMSGAFNLSGGTYISTSGTLTVTAHYTVSGAGVFTHNSGTISFPSGGSVTITPGTADYNHVNIVGTTTNYELAGTMSILGTLTIGRTNSTTYYINTGTLLAKGDVSFVNNGYAGSALIKIAGSGNQTLTGVSTSKIPSLEIASTGGTVFFVGTLSTIFNYTYTSGSVNTGTSTLEFVGSTTGTLVAPGSVGYYNVTFGGYTATYNLSAATMTVNGTLTVGKTGSGSYQIDNGTILAKGNVVFNNNGYSGSALIKVAGSGNQSVSGIATSRNVALEIASTGGVVTLSGTISLHYGFTYTSGVVDAGTSTLEFNGNVDPTYIVPGPINFYNVSFVGYTAMYDLQGQTMTVTNTLTLGRTSGSSYNINNGTLLAKGDVSFINNGYYGTALLKVAGNTNQTITGISSSAIPPFEIASTGGTVTLSGTLAFVSDFTYTSGTVAAGTSTVVFASTLATATITPGTVSYNDVTFSARTTYTLSGTMTVNGTLTFSKPTSSSYAINSGNFIANGNVVMSSYGYNGTATVGIAGSTSTTLAIASSAATLTPSIVINKSGGASVSLASDSAFKTTGQDLTLAAGTLDLNGYTLAVPDVLTIDAGATLRCNGGVFTYGSFVANGTINCPGYSGYEFNWTGATGDGNFSTAGNWTGGVAPGPSNVAVFQNTFCGANCNANITANTSLRGLIIYSPYTGTITQGAGQTLTVGSRGWKQAAGTFIGGTANMTIDSELTVSGGSFKATSATTTLNTATVAIASGSTWDHSNGTFTFSENTGGNSVVHDFGGKSLYNVNFTGNGAPNLSSTLPVLGNLNINISSNASKIVGQIDLSGNMTVQNHEYAMYAKIRYVGGANQTVTTSGAVGAQSTNVGRPIFQKTAGTVTFTGNTTFYGVDYISGNVAISAGTTTVFDHFIATDCWALDTMTPGTIQFQSVQITGCGPRSLIGTMSVLGNLTIGIGNSAAGLRNGKIQVAGNYDLNSDENYSSSTEIEMVGSSPSTVTVVGTNINPGHFTVSKTGGAAVNLATNLIVRNGASDVRVASGVLNMLGKNLTIGNASGTDNVLTLESGAIINRAGGVLTYESLVNNGGTINP